MINAKKARLAIIESEIESLSSESTKQLQQYESIKLKFIGSDSKETSEYESENRKLMLERMRRRTEFFVEDGYRRFCVWAIPGWKDALCECGFNDTKEAWTWFDEAIKSETVGDD